MGVGCSTSSRVWATTGTSVAWVATTATPVAGAAASARDYIATADVSMNDVGIACAGPEPSYWAERTRWAVTCQMQGSPALPMQIGQDSAPAELNTSASAVPPEVIIPVEVSPGSATADRPALASPQGNGESAGSGGLDTDAAASAPSGADVGAAAMVEASGEGGSGAGGRDASRAAAAAVPARLACLCTIITVSTLWIATS